jgi:NADH-quinone oxidoreductase subunit J
MTATLAIFFVLAALAIIGALSLILQKHPIHSALSLIVVMVALAGLYLLMGAEFVAAVQIIVYGGAIMVLFVFVIMLLNAGAEERTRGSNMALVVGVPGVIILAGTVAWLLVTDSTHLGGVNIGPSDFGETHAIARLLFRNFLLPFEVTSVLVLIAIMGAVVLGKKEN